MKYGSRKFLLTVLTIMSACGLLLVGSIGEAVWGATVGSALALYMAGNVGRAAVNKTVPE